MASEAKVRASKLGDFLETHDDEIVERWRVRAASASALGGTELLNSVRHFLGELVATLRADADLPHEPRIHAWSKWAAEHGADRNRHGYEIGPMIREYGMLRDVVFDVIDEAHEEFSYREMRLLASRLVSGIADAAEKFALGRDALRREEAAKHLGFLAHELRNPLGSVRLAFEALQRTQDPELRERLYGVIGRGHVRLGDTIDHALMASRLETGVPLSRETVRLTEVIREVMQDSEAEIGVKKLHVVVEADGTLEIVADRKLISSALSNLVRNAIKFTREAGAVVVRVRPKEGAVLVEIQDECGGLPAGTTDRLFQPYTQGSPDRTGFGLGLAITKQAIEAHGGTVRVFDRPGHGCTFVVEIPR